MSSFHHTSEPVCPLCEEKLSQAHEHLATWFRTIVKPKWPDAHVSWSYRGKEDQEKAFADAKTRLHFPKSAHNHQPALALDLFQLNEDGVAVWSPKFFAQVALLNKGEYPNLVWGGTFKTLGDGDHFELLINPDDPTLSSGSNQRKPKESGS